MAEIVTWANGTVTYWRCGERTVGCYGDDYQPFASSIYTPSAQLQTGMKDSEDFPSWDAAMEWLVTGKLPEADPDPAPAAAPTRVEIPLSSVDFMSHEYAQAIAEKADCVAVPRSGLDALARTLGLPDGSSWESIRLNGELAACNAKASEGRIAALNRAVNSHLADVAALRGHLESIVRVIGKEGAPFTDLVPHLRALGCDERLPAKRSKPTKVAELRPGDRVRIAKGGHWFDEYVGDVHTIDDIGFGGAWGPDNCGVRTMFTDDGTRPWEFVSHDEEGGQ